MSGLLALVLHVGGDFPAAAWEGMVQGGYFLLLLLAGAAGGAVFSLSASLWRPTGAGAASGAGLFYAADLLGATLGALGFSLVIIPVWGVLPALMAVAALHAIAALLLTGRGCGDPEITKACRLTRKNLRHLMTGPPGLQII